MVPEPVPEPALVAVDLFCGCGGLTVGLKRAGFSVAAGVELDPVAFSSFKVNHPEVRGYRQDIRTISGTDLLEDSPTGSVDLIAACPPCQGFSSLTSKYRRSDPRDTLVDEVTRLVSEIKPAALMMENVPGLARKGRAIFDRLCGALRDGGYHVRWDILEVADFGIPQRRKRLVLIAGLGFDIELPLPTHSNNDEKSGLLPWRTVRDTIEGMPEPVVLDESFDSGGPQAFDWHVVRRLSRANQARIRHAKAGKSWTGIPKRLRPECHQDKMVGFQNVYGRLAWDEPSSTITGGCTTLSKGRFGHPSQNRTLSLREAALLQTFPADYIFDTDYMEYACDMVGNALPCEFAAIVAAQCNRAVTEARTREC